MVKFVISSSEIAAAAACHVPRGVRFNSPPGYTPIQMLVLGIGTLIHRSTKFWRESLYGIPSPPPEVALNKLVAQWKKGPELPRICDNNVDQWAALAAKDLGEAEAPDAYKNYQQMDDYTWEIIMELDDDSIPFERKKLEFPLCFNSTKHYQLMLENQEKLSDYKNNHIIP